jgi:hypothetical protein
MLAQAFAGENRNSALTSEDRADLAIPQGPGHSSRGWAADHPVSPLGSPGEAEPGGAKSARVVTPPCGAEASLGGGSRSISKRSARNYAGIADGRRCFLRLDTPPITIAPTINSAQVAGSGTGVSVVRVKVAPREAL